MRIWRLWKILVFLTLLAVISSGYGISTAQAPGQGGAQEERMVPGIDFVPGEVLVRFREGRFTLQAENYLQSVGAKRINSLPGPRLEVWNVPEGTELDLVERLSGEPDVEIAGLNLLYHLTTVPDDPRYPQQWAHTQANAPVGWDITTGTGDVVIAIIDSGVDLDHPDLKAKLTTGKNLYNSEPTAGDKHGHGTHVAGIAAAISNNGVGIAGVSWGARIMPVRVTDSLGRAPTSAVVDGIHWAVANGAKVINLSLGSSRRDSVLADEIARAQAAGALVVASAGNDSTNDLFFPAALDGVLAVGATGPSGDLAPYSNYGSYLDVVAPGGTKSLDPSGILSTVPTYDVYLNTHEPRIARGYEYLAGTSMAAPYVSGLAALVWSLNLDLSPAQVSQVITSTVKDLGSAGWDERYGYGLVDVGAAVATARAGDMNISHLSTIENPHQSDEYTIRWSPVAGAGSYTLEEANNDAFSGAIVRYQGPELEYSVTGQKSGTWYYRVRPEVPGGNNHWSEPKGTTVGPSPLDAPELNEAEYDLEAKVIKLSWRTVADAEEYIVEESGEPYFSHPKVIYRGSQREHNVTGKSGGKWYFRVRAFSSEGSGPWSVMQVTLQHTLALPIIHR